MRKLLKTSIIAIGIILMLSAGSMAFGEKILNPSPELGQTLYPLATVNQVAFWNIPGQPYYLVTAPMIRLTPYGANTPGTQVWPPQADFFAGLSPFVNPSIVFTDTFGAPGTYDPRDAIYVVGDINSQQIVTNDLRLTWVDALLPGTKVIDNQIDMGRHFVLPPAWWYIGYVDVDGSTTFTPGDRVYLHTYQPDPNHVSIGDVRLSP